MKLAIIFMLVLFGVVLVENSEVKQVNCPTEVNENVFLADKALKESKKVEWYKVVITTCE